MYMCSGMEAKMGSGALSGPVLCTQYNYDTIYSTDLNPNLNIIRNAGPDNAPDPQNVTYH